jgi:hypothetical protein
VEVADAEHHCRHGEEGGDSEGNRHDDPACSGRSQKPPEALGEPGRHDVEPVGQREPAALGLHLGQEIFKVRSVVETP